MDDDTTRHRRDELHRHLANSRKVRQLVVRIGAAIGAVGLGLWLGGAGTTIGLGVAALGAIVGGSGAWVTHGHIAEFQHQLRDLEPRRARRAP